jgi:hypothetical protein
MAGKQAAPMVNNMRRTLFTLIVALVVPMVPLAAQETPTIDVAAVFESSSGLEMRRWEIPVHSSKDFVGDLSSQSPVLAAGVVNRRYALADPRRSEQWGLSRLDVDKVRELGTGDGVVVAVIDTGVDASHPELQGRVLPGLDLVDDGGDGRKDPNGHGTHVAGIIAGAVDGSGMEGLAPNAVILPVRVLGPDGSGDDADVAYGILWAARNGARVINLSLGGTEQDPLLKDAIREVTQSGVVVVAAAGNSGASGDIYFPAAHPQVIAVGATGPDDRAALYSTRGDYVDISAPGTMILSTWPGGYRYESGTSMATPFVSAAAAILLGRNLAPQEIAVRLVSSAFDLDQPGVDSNTGAGLVDVVAAATTGEPRAEQPGSIGRPQFPNPSLPGLPSPTLPGVPLLPNLPTFPQLPERPQLPDRPNLPKPTLPNWPVPSFPNVPDLGAGLPVRGTLAPSPAKILLLTKRSAKTVHVSIDLRIERFPLAYRKVQVVTYDGSRTRRFDVRTDASGKAFFPSAAAVRKVSVRWSGDLVSTSAASSVTVQ